jgi:cytochrome c-type biogenesis protein CcmF
MLNWRRSDFVSLVKRLRWPLSLSAGAAGFGLFLFGVSKFLTAFGIALGIFLILGAFAVIARRLIPGKDVQAKLSQLARATPLAIWGLAVAHAGLGVTTIGVTAMSTFQSSAVLAMRPGQSVMLAGDRVTLENVGIIRGANFEANQAQFRIEGPWGARELFSQRRFFPASQTETTLAGIGTGFFRNTYISIGDESASGGRVVRMWNHPLVNWIWAGALLMALGGTISLADRRLRVGAALSLRPRVPQSESVPA